MRESQKRKIIHDEVVLVKKKKEHLSEYIAFLVSYITKYSTEAEVNRDFTLPTKANTFRIWEKKPLKAGMLH